MRGLFAWLCPRAASQGPRPSRIEQGMQLAGLELQRRGTALLRDLRAWKSGRVRTIGGKTHQCQQHKSVYTGTRPGGSSPQERQDLRGYQQRQNDRLGTGPSFLIAIMKFEVCREPKCHLGKARWRKSNPLKDRTLMPKKARNLADWCSRERNLGESEIILDIELSGHGKVPTCPLELSLFFCLVPFSDHHRKAGGQWSWTSLGWDSHHCCSY